MTLKSDPPVKQERRFLSALLWLDFILLLLFIHIDKSENRAQEAGIRRISGFARGETDFDESRFGKITGTGIGVAAIIIPVFQ